MLPLAKESIVGNLLEDTEALKKVLLRHVVPGTFFRRGITWGTFPTAGGQEEDTLATQVFKKGVLRVVSNVSGEEGAATAATVEEADIIASNGVIHAVDAVI